MQVSVYVFFDEMSMLFRFKVIKLSTVGAVSPLFIRIFPSAGTNGRQLQSMAQYVIV